MFASVLAVLVIILLALWAYRAYLVRLRPVRKINSERPVSGDSEELELPKGYGQDRLTALVKDPDWLYAYWEITPRLRFDFEKQQGAKAWETSQPVLRVYDQTAATYWDVSIDDFAASWYIEATAPRHTLFLEYGRYVNDLYYPLLTSNLVTMPARDISPEIDPLWPPLDDLWRVAMSSLGHPGRYNSTDIQQV